MKSVSALKEEFNAKMARVRDEYKLAAKDVKEKAKAEAKTSKGKEPIKIGKVDLSGVDLSGIFSVVVDRETGEITGRYPKPSFMEVANPKIAELKAKRNSSIAALKTERDKELLELNKDKRLQRAKAMESKLKAEEEKLAKLKEKLNSLRA